MHLTHSVSQRYVKCLTKTICGITSFRKYDALAKCINPKIYGYQVKLYFEVA